MSRPKEIPNKFEVFRAGEKVENCFVLRPQDDPSAFLALKTYAKETNDEQLKHALEKWIDNIEKNWDKAFSKEPEEDSSETVQ